MAAPPPPGPGELPGHVNDSCYVHMLLEMSDPLFLTNTFPEFFLYHLPRLCLQLFLIFGFSQALHICLRRFHQPRIVSEILAGVIMGNMILGRIPNFSEYLFPQDGEVMMDAMAKIGYTLFIFLSGVKMDPNMVFRNGLKSWIIGSTAIMLPVFGTMGLFFGFQKWETPYRWPSIKELLGVQTIISFPVIASVLVDLKVMNSELGRLSLAAALISDMLINVVNTVIYNLRMGWLGWMNIMIVRAIVLTYGSLVVTALVGRPVARWIIRRTPEGRKVKTRYIVLVWIMVLLSMLLTDNAGLFFQYGPFILGLSIPDGPPLGSTLVDQLEAITSGIYAPLMVTYCSLKMDVLRFTDLRWTAYVCFLLMFCLCIKFVSTLGSAVACSVPLRDALPLAIIMSTQGIVQMTFVYNYTSNQTFDDETFSMVTAFILLISVATNYLIKLTYDPSRTYSGFQKRDVQHTAPTAELRILACAHRLDDVLALKKLIETSSPTRNSPLMIYGLQLVELSGRAHPQLIDHQLGQKTASTGTAAATRAMRVQEVFRSIAKQYSGGAYVQLYTTVSLLKFMHHDICMLAFDKSASLIILPFHRKWNYQGTMMQESGVMRQTNIEVLELAPCSAAILVDRHRVKRTTQPASTYNIAVIFIGGPDDREALALANRISHSEGVHMTVIRFLSYDNIFENQWDGVLDAEMLKEVRIQGQYRSNMGYKEEKVKDGSETALIVHAMEEEYDLILVGRRHPDSCHQLAGLTEWNDLPELGPLGDMLAAPEIGKPLSVLVVQHQTVKKK